MISRHPLSPSPRICVEAFMWAWMWGAAGPSHFGPSHLELACLTQSLSLSHTHTYSSNAEGCGGRAGVPWHTNRHDRNKIKRVGLRQNMYGPLNRELIKELKLLVLSCLITHQQSHYLNSGDPFKCLLKQRRECCSGKTNEFTSFSRGKCLNPVPSIPIWVITRLWAGAGRKKA